MKCEKWRALKIDFKAKRAISEIQEAEADVTFTHKATGKKISIPAFWNGKCDWAVRAALTETGEWNYLVFCKDDTLGLDGISGTVECVPYSGEYEIYRRGFIKTEPDKRYFVYDDGTPFFYLGDTHWAMLDEEFDSPGPHAADIKCDSHFKYIVDRRAEQKFNVYQSEPINHRYNLNDGIDDNDVEEFKRVDRYFEYIADRGMLHANAQFIFPSEITERYFNDKAFLRSVSRYWIARYAAYPVLWTLGQEVDRSYFGNNGITPENNPYKDICRYLYEFDPYKHPITAHQENAMLAGALGGSKASDLAWGDYVHTSGKSTFYGMKEHTWWGVQWRPDMARQHNYAIPKDYWFNGENKVSINYETRYDYLYTKHFGARANGWISFLCGMYGYGYGAADMWAYLNKYSLDIPSTDGLVTVTPEEKHTPWGESIKFVTGDQMTYMRDFFESLEWWKLIPDFDLGKAFVCANDEEVFHSAAYDGNKTYVVYFYNLTAKTDSKLVNMEGEYTAKWFNPVTGEYTLISDSIVPENGEWIVPEKAADRDAVLLVTKKA